MSPAHPFYTLGPSTHPSLLEGPVSASYPPCQLPQSDVLPRRPGHAPPRSQARADVLQIAVRPTQPDSTPTVSPLPSRPSAVSTATRTKIPAARSAAACNMCRTQKMKCEGPDHAPCRRCVKNNVDCVFGESQGRARQILWSKRTEELEMKVSKHGEDLQNAMAMMANIQELLELSSENKLKRKFDSIDERTPELVSNFSLSQTTSSELGPLSSPVIEQSQSMSFCQAIQAARQGPRRSDLVDKGILSCSRAKELFEIHRKDWAPQIPWLNLPDTFENVRKHSPLMLAVGCSTGAKGLKNVKEYRKAKANVIALMIDVLSYRFFPHERPQSYQDVIAVIGCIVHCGLGLDPALVVDYAEHLKLRDVFDRIPEDRWQGESDQRQLLSVARTFIGVYIHTVLFSTLTAKPCVMQMDKEVLMMYCDIICKSPYSIPEWDGLLKYYIQYYSIMEEAQINLDSHYRLGPVQLGERFEVVKKYSESVHLWNEKRKRELRQKGTEIPPKTKLEFELMYHRGMTYMACFATSESGDGREILSCEGGQELAQQGVAHAMEILKEFVCSRLSNPHLPCVHLEYRKATMCIATAYIVEACLLIPDYIDFVNCLRMIKKVTEELQKEGEEWGGGTEDSYVTTLQKLSAQLDAALEKRPERQRKEAMEHGLELIKPGFEDKNLSPVWTSPDRIPPSLHAQDPLPRQGIGLPESRGLKGESQTSVSAELGKGACLVYEAPPVLMSSSATTLDSHNLVSSAWLVDSAACSSTFNPDPKPKGMGREVDRDHQSVITASSLPASVSNVLAAPPTPWLDSTEFSPSLHYSLSPTVTDPITHLQSAPSTVIMEHPTHLSPNPVGSAPYLIHSNPIPTQPFQNQVALQPDGNVSPLRSADVSPNHAFVVPEQTSNLLQSLRSVYSDRFIQTCIQTSL